LSIKKPYADAIFRGEKVFEFRRSVFRKAVDVVIVYVTSPTCQVAGEFDVSDVISESVEDLWSRTSDNAGIASAISWIIPYWAKLKKYVAPKEPV
jgi:predicted transcriptional regulator